MTQIIHVEAKCDEPVASPVDVSREESPVPKKVSVFAEVEKESRNLLSNFQVYVSDLMKESFENNMPDQMEKMCLDPHKANDAIQLYLSLQSSLRTTFEKITSNMNISFPSGILDLPVMDEHLKQDQYLDNTATPGQMLQDINQIFNTCEEDFENVSESVQNIHIKGKEQSCKMCLVCENLVEMEMDKDENKDNDNDDNDKPLKPKVDTQKQQHPGKHRLSPLSSVAEKPKIRQLSHKEEVSPKILRNRPVVKINAQQPFEIPQIDAKPFRELLERYEKEMALEGERIMREEMRAGKHQLSVESQMTNLRVLHRALLNKHISTALYYFAKDLIKYSLSVNEMRLACLMRKFIAHHTLRQVRYRHRNSTLMFLIYIVCGFTVVLD